MRQTHRERLCDDKQKLQGYGLGPASREHQELERQEGRPREPQKVIHHVHAMSTVLT